MLLWAQKVLDSKKANFPKITNLETMEIADWITSTSSDTEMTTEKCGDHDKEPPST
jgi:hypothetical protein